MAAMKGIREEGPALLGYVHFSCLQTLQEILMEGVFKSVKKMFPCYRRMSRDAKPALVSFNQEEKLVAKEYFDNEWKACRDIPEQGKVNKLWVSSSSSSFFFSFVCFGF